MTVLLSPGVWMTQDGEPIVGGARMTVELETRNFAVATNFLRYIPFTGLSIATLISTYYVMKVMPAAGRLAEIRCYSEADAGSTVWGICKNLNTTPVETVTANMGAGVVTTFTFTSPLHFAADDIICISQDPTNIPTACIATLEWHYQ